MKCKKWSEVERIYSKLVLLYVAQRSSTFHGACFFPRGYTLETFGKVAFFNDYIKKHNP